jgi:hypothetical protein
MGIVRKAIGSAVGLTLSVLLGSCGSLSSSSGASPRPTTACSPNPNLTSEACPPTPMQMAALSGIAIPPSPTAYTSTYQGFTDWNQSATFRIPQSAVSTYTSLPDFPGVTIGGPAVEATRPLVSGQHRTLQLSQASAAVEVKITVFTT